MTGAPYCRVCGEEHMRIPYCLTCGEGPWSDADGRCHSCGRDVVVVADRRSVAVLDEYCRQRAPTPTNEE